MTEVVFSSVAGDADLQGTLFQGRKFWFSQRVPQRSRFINEVRANGGEVLLIEKNADVKIVDHARKEALPGTYSYTYVETSVRNGVLEVLADHAVGPSEGTVRGVGSVVQPAKMTRNKYTETDDGILWTWVSENPQKGGGTDGNEIYKQLEAKHPQHPWQSWRDRWIKHLKGRPHPFSLPYNAPPTPPSDAPAATEQSKKPQIAEDDNEDDDDLFSEADVEALVGVGEDIMNIDPEKTGDAWDAWTREIDKDGRHSAQQWQSFWEEKVRPRYLKRKAKQTGNVTVEQLDASGSQTPMSPKKIKTAPLSAFSSLARKKPKAESVSTSPSYPVGPPMLRSPGIQTFQGATIILNSLTTDVAHLAAQGEEENKIQPEETGSVYSETLKRKHDTLGEEIPSSSPLGPAFSPKRRRQTEPKPLREIPSTPERPERNKKSPGPSGKRASSPLFIEDNTEEELGLEDDEHENGTLLGQPPSDTLSEPDQRARNTQAIFQDSSQEIDFNVPPPNEGWDDEDAIEDPKSKPDYESDFESDYESAMIEINDPRPSLPNTQAILESETQRPDFDLPEPEGGWDSVPPSSPPPMASSPQAESEISQTNIGAQVDAWIEAHVDKGFSDEQVESVLKSTSMDTSLADEVLSLMAEKGEMPKNMPGVWTEADDEDLGSTDARKIQRSQDKHGVERWNARFEFLSFYRGYN